MTALPATQQPNEGEIHDHIAVRLAEDGWCVVADYLEAAAVKTLRTEALGHWQEGCYHLARVGRGEMAAHQPDVRCDHVLWFEPPYSAAQTAYLARMEALRQAINRRLLLGLFDFECHYTRYASGAFYRRHLDRFRDDSRRTVSSILYLNDTWYADDVGMLRLWPGAQGAGGSVDIVPNGGTLVCFLSSDIWHEVLPTGRERLSLTGWFRTRP